MKKYASQWRIEQLFAEIHSEWIKIIARLAGNISSWTRRRAMPLDDIVKCALAKKGLSTVMEVRHYFQEAEKMEQTVSKQDYLQRRKQLNPVVFKLLNRNYLRRFYAGDEAKGWRGYLVLAVDGSQAEIPNSAENRRVYGESNKREGAVARAAVSVLYDVYNRFVLDIQINEGSEIAAAKEHVEALQAITGERPVLLLFDRNYPSLEFVDFLEKRGIKYLIRLKSTDYKAEIGQMRSRDGEAEIVCTKSRLYHLRRTSPGRARELELQGAVRVRVVQGKCADGEPLVVITNLREGTSGGILRLYRKRWLIEQQYHTFKNKLKLESVTGKASIYVEQDFWAQTLVYNIVRDLIQTAERRAVRAAKKKQLKYTVRINENIAIGLFKEQCIRLMVEPDERLKERMFRQLIADMEKHIVPVRKNLKSSPRKWNHANKYKCNLKPSF